MPQVGTAAPPIRLLDTEGGLTVRTVDLHVGGQPIRVVGLADAADVETALPAGCLDRLCAVPRGRASDVFLLYAPTEDGFYARFRDVVGPIDMCGEGLIALATLARLSGLVPADERFRIHTAHGAVQVRVSSQTGAATVRLPAARVRATARLPGPAGTEVLVSVADGAGNVFAIVDAAQWGVALTTGALDAIAAAGLQVREQLRRALGPGAPTMVQFAEFGALPASRNVVVWGPGPNLDLGPCGTGSAARAAVLHAAGALPVGARFDSAGLSGQTMGVRLVEAGAAGPGAKVVVELTATAHLTGQVDHYLSTDDDLFGLVAPRPHAEALA
jgi:proline racemase